ncbi:hypothetical protein FB45DRAFT_864403 [Roridomyces roridus]|uniref:Uncharacterized protein n=1 Tax=Roridomyces roridus TaxID=1738132 RepID=A0AAD7C109_9AGAR|nr:hypothetical protein FB45DRAFT_864403 [Roridomyces roridus]
MYELQTPEMLGDGGRESLRALLQTKACVRVPTLHRRGAGTIMSPLPLPHTTPPPPGRPRHHGQPLPPLTTSNPPVNSWPATASHANTTGCWNPTAPHGHARPPPAPPLPYTGPPPPGHLPRYYGQPLPALNINVNAATEVFKYGTPAMQQHDQSSYHNPHYAAPIHTVPYSSAPAAEWPAAYSGAGDAVWNTPYAYQFYPEQEERDMNDPQYE